MATQTCGDERFDHQAILAVRNRLSRIISERSLYARQRERWSLSERSSDEQHFGDVREIPEHCLRT